MAKRISTAAAYISGLILLLFFADISSFSIIMMGYALAFAAYFLILKDTQFDWKSLLHLGWTVRIVAVFAFPQLSDDIYRFIWDGILNIRGINPFAHLPIDIEIRSSYERLLLEKMNSPKYFSVYPPVLQLLFSAVALFPHQIYLHSVIFKIILLVFEFITFRTSISVLNSLGLNHKKFLIYFLNPLVVVELMGNLHFELIMISLLSCFLSFFVKQKWIQSGVMLSLSVASKLMTLLITPIVLRPFNWKKAMCFYGSFVVSLVLLFLPMIWNTYQHFGAGLDLYFQKFEFNASIYYLIRYVGFQLYGYNIIQTLGPFLTIMAAIIMLVIALSIKEKSVCSVLSRFVVMLTVYYLLGTTVHPWYVTTMVFCCVFTNLRYPIIWSMLISLSYSKYYNGGELYFYSIAVEYLFLGIAIVFDYNHQLKHKKRAVSLNQTK